MQISEERIIVQSGCSNCGRNKDQIKKELFRNLFLPKNCVSPNPKMYNSKNKNIHCEKMFLVGDNFVWTKQGLRRVNEVKSGHQVLGVDREGSPCWLELSSSPTLIGREKSMIHIILDRSEIKVAPTCELCGKEGILKAGQVEENDKLEVFSDPKYIYKELEKTSIDFIDKIYIKGYGVIPLTTQNSYLLGILSQRSVVPAIWSTGAAIIKMPTGGAEWTIERLKEVVHDFNLIAIRGDRRWSYLEFQSSIVDLVKKLPPLKTILSEVLRSNYSILHGFIKGFIDVRSILLENTRRIVTRIEEVELRKIMYNLFFIHSVRCFTSVAKYPDDHLCYIDVPFPDLISFYKRKPPSRTLSAWARVKEIYRIKGERYAFYQSKKIHWSPIMDLVLLA